MTNKNSILVLNGVSSSGKSTLAKALQHVLTPTFLHVSLDGFGEMFPEEVYDREDGFKAVLSAMVIGVKGLATLGYNIIIDCVLEEEDSLSLVLKSLAEFSVSTVGVYCSPTVLEEREILRGDREIGLAVRQLQYVHFTHQYDYEIDTSHKDPSNLACEIVSALGL